MIKDVVIHSGLLRIATGTFVCMVRLSENGRLFLGCRSAIGPRKSPSIPSSWADVIAVSRIMECSQLLEGV
jgi:hypothetical protein